MKKLIIAALMSVAAVAAHADYIYNVDSNTRWSVLDSQHIVLHQYGRPTAVLKLMGCFPNRASQLTLLQDHYGPYDGKIFVDGTVCDVIDVKKL